MRLENTRAKTRIPIEQPNVYQRAEKPYEKAAWVVPTVEEPPTMVPTIPPNTRAEEADFLPLKSFPFCFLEDSALTDNMRNRIRIRPKYIISGE